MSKFKVSFKDSQIFVKSKLDKNEDINQSELQLFQDKLIRGLMRPKETGKRKIEYLAPGNVTLFTYLQSGITKDDFFVVFAQLVECIKKIERNGLNINNLVMNTKYTFYNQVTREVQFLYQPIENPQQQNNIFSYIYEIAQSTVLALNENSSFLNDLINYIRNLKTFSVAGIEQYIYKTYPKVYKTVRRSKTGDSVSLKQTGRTYFDKKYDTTVTDDDTDVLDENGDDDGTDVLIDEEDDLGTDVLDGEDDFGGTDVLEDDDEGEGTTVLDGSEGTTVLKNQEQPFPYLIRICNYEKVKINKPAFRIGKEKSYVDYFVMNNNAVSRIHADIITKDNQYFIKDNNSTNHTFVNGTMVPVNQTVEIFDGDAIMLANESFEFHIE